MIIALLVLTIASSTGSEEVLETISSSPDERYMIAIAYPSQAAKEEDKRTYTWQANYGSRPVILIDTRNGTRIGISSETIAQVIDVNWLPGIAGFGYYERDEANWRRDLYLIDPEPKLAVRPIKLPDLKALVKANGDDPEKHFDPKFEFLSQELGDCRTEGIIEVLLVTRWQYGRSGITPTLRYISRFATMDYKSFELVFLKRERHPIQEDPLPDTILIDKTKAEQGGADQPAAAPESKSAGKEKPKPESEGRAQ